MDLCKKFLLIYNTAKHLKTSQIAYRILFYLKKYIIFKFFRKSYSHYLSFNNKIEINDKFNFQSNESSIKNEYLNFEKNEFNFLNSKYSFGSKINWLDDPFFQNNTLWKFNLNYHNFLFEIISNKDLPKKYKVQTIQSIISSWIQDNDFSQAELDPDNWNSYVVSNRIIAWIKIYSIYKNDFSNDFKLLFLKNLKFHSNFLSRNFEYHLRGNHLLENAFALLFSAYFFNDKYFYRRSSNVLTNELHEQILIDGGHFELSPMYHQHILKRMLDTIRLIKDNEIFDSSLIELIENKSSKMLSWLENLAFKNGDLPQVNDSSSSVYLSLNELKKYSEQINLKKSNLELSDSGYRKYVKNNYECLIDVGKIGPDYILGHAHNDIFSFILYVNNKPFIIDRGISTYNYSKIRLEEKSTSSHNTVMIAGNEQNEIWSNFRVAKRTYPKIHNQKNNYIKASYNSIYKNASHNREFYFNENNLFLRDYVNNECVNFSYLHFDPNVNPILNDNILTTKLVTIVLKNFRNIILEDYDYCYGFNKIKKAKRLKMEFIEESKIQINITNNF
tara:strand:+ start:9907 stop:11583 length:1677 start_codon:yes stop_codon:yes gene_type:complete